MKQFNLQVMIAEMGIRRTLLLAKSAWLSDAVHSSQQFPLLRDIIYFNTKDTPGAWPGLASTCPTRTRECPTFWRARATFVV